MPPMAANARQGGFFGILFVPYKKYVKARRACCRQGRDTAVRRKKDLIWFVRNRYLCALNRGLENLEAPFGKGFNCCGAKLRLRCADSRFAKPRNFLQGRTGCHFLHRAKSNQKARGAKPCDPRFKALSEVILKKLPAAHVETGFLCKTPA